MRYEESILLPQKHKVAFRQFLIALFFTIINSLLALVFFLLLRKPIASILNADELEILLLAIPLFIFARGSFLILQQWHAREEKYKQISTALLTESAFWNGGSALSGLFGFTGGAIIAIFQLLGQTAAASYLTYTFVQGKKDTGITHFTWMEFKNGISDYRKFPLYNMLSKLLDNAALYIPTLLFSAFFSPAFAGQYTLGFNLLQLPFSMLGGSLGQVLYQRTSKFNDKKHISSVVKNVLSPCLTFSIYPALVCAIIGPELIKLLFGSNWTEAGYFVQILSPWMLFIFLSLVVERIPSVVGKNENILIFHTMNSIVRIIALILGSVYRDPFLAVILLSAGGSIVYLGNFLSVTKLAGLSLVQTILLIIKKLSFSTPFLLTIFVIKLWFLPTSSFNEIELILSAVLIGLIYYIFGLLFQPSARELITQFLRKTIK